MNIERAVMVIAALVLVFVIAKINSAIKLINNRLNILSQTQKNIHRELQTRFGIGQDADLAARDDAMKSKLDRDFRA